MRVTHSNWRIQRSWAALLGIFCIALVMMTGIVQVTHAHPAGQADTDCSLCVTAHQAIHLAALVTLDITSRPVAPVAPEEARSLPRQRFLQKLSIRPPPAAPSFA